MLFTRRAAEERVPLLTFLALIIASFVFGGSARYDVLSLVLLRPLAAVGCAAALLTLRREHIARHRAIFWLYIAILLLIIVHLVPLPPSVWQALPGRQVIGRADQLAGLSGIWRPLTMTPDGAWNAFFAMLVPFAVLLSGMQLQPSDLRRAVPVFLAIALVSSLLGFLQVIGGPGSALYTFRITNEDNLVGLFANRNHQAYFLASVFPILADYAGRPARDVQQATRRRFACGFSALLLAPILLATGSRGGLIMAVLGIGAGIWLYREPEVHKHVRKGGNWARLQWVGIAAGVLCVAGVLLVILSRTNSLNRLASTSPDEELRLQIWPVISKLAWHYLPFGSGMGSFVEAYQVSEPDRLLMPIYVNHAHNDLLEVWMTAGVPGIVLLVAALLIIARLGLAAVHNGSRLGKLGLTVAAMLLISSIGDYPLRTPALMAMITCALLFLSASTFTRTALDSQSRVGSVKPRALKDSTA